MFILRAMPTLFWVALGGAIGASARHLVGVQAMRLLGHGFPWGTLAVNIMGSLLMGLLIEVMALKFDPGPHARAFLVTGVLGGFTTFSAFSLDVAVLWERGAGAQAGAYVAASVICSVAALFAGFWLARSVLV